MIKEIVKVHTGMGAIAHENGTAFRVWAPHAEKVFLTGSFNEFNKESLPMRKEESGTWYLDVPAANAGDEYRYRILFGGKEFSRIDPYAREVSNSVGNGIVHDDSFDWGDHAFQLPPLNELIVYELHIGSFNPRREGQVGTFRSAQRQLRYLQKLGVNLIEIMPSAEFAGDFSWGYNPAHIFAVESSYGGPNALKEFVREAHKLGIGVIMDVVYNHFGPSDLNLWQFDGWTENNKGGIYFYNDWKSSTPWGDTRPDYGRGEVRQFIHDNAMMWLEEYRIDGLRFDMTLYMRHVRGDDDPGADLPDGWSLAQWINKDIRERFPHAICIAEDLRNNSGITESPDLGGAGFHSQWDASFVHPIRGAVITPEDHNRSMIAVRDAILACYNNDAFRRVVYSESHDEVANGKARIPTEVSPDDPQGFFARKRSVLAASLVFTAPGVPMIFQGQEFLQDEWFRDDHPLKWELANEYPGIVQSYRDLCHLRLNRNGISRGLCGQHVHVFHVNDDQNVLAFRRWDKGGIGDDVIVVVNFSNEARVDYRLGLPLPGKWKLSFNSGDKKYFDDYGIANSCDIVTEAMAYDGFDHSGLVSIGPYVALIYTKPKDEPTTGIE